MTAVKGLFASQSIKARPSVTFSSTSLPIGTKLPLHAMYLNSSGLAVVGTTNSTPIYTFLGTFPWIPNFLYTFASLTYYSGGSSTPAFNGISTAQYYTAPAITQCNPANGTYGVFGNVLNNTVLNPNNTLPSIGVTGSTAPQPQLTVGANPITDANFNALNTRTNDLTFSTDVNSTLGGKAVATPSWRDLILGNFHNNYPVSTASTSDGFTANNTGITISTTTTSAPQSIAQCSALEVIGLSKGMQAGIRYNQLMVNGQDKIRILKDNNNYYTEGVTLDIMGGLRGHDVYTTNISNEYNCQNLTMIMGDLFITDPTLPAVNGYTQPFNAQIAAAMVLPTAGGVNSGFILNTGWYVLPLRAGMLITLNPKVGVISTSTGLFFNTPTLREIPDKIAHMRHNAQGLVEGVLQSDVIMYISAYAQFNPLPAPYYTTIGTGTAGTTGVIMATPNGQIDAIQLPNNLPSPVLVSGAQTPVGSFGGYSQMEWLRCSLNTGQTNVPTSPMFVTPMAQAGSKLLGQFTYMRMMYRLPIAKTWMGRTDQDLMQDNILSTMRIQTGLIDQDIKNNCPVMLLTNTARSGNPMNLQCASVGNNQVSWQQDTKALYDASYSNFYTSFPVTYTIGTQSYTVTINRYTLDKIDYYNLLNITPDYFWNTSVGQLLMQYNGNGAFNTNSSLVAFPSIYQNVTINTSVYQGGQIALQQVMPVYHPTLQIHLGGPMQNNYTLWDNLLQKGQSGAYAVGGNAEFGVTKDKVQGVPSVGQQSTDNPSKDSLGGSLVQRMEIPSGFPSIPEEYKYKEMEYSLIVGGSQWNTAQNAIFVARSLAITAGQPQYFNVILSRDTAVLNVPATPTGQAAMPTSILGNPDIKDLKEFKKLVKITSPNHEFSDSDLESAYASMSESFSDVKFGDHNILDIAIEVYTLYKGELEKQNIDFKQIGSHDPVFREVLALVSNYHNNIAMFELNIANDIATKPFSNEHISLSRKLANVFYQMKYGRIDAKGHLYGLLYPQSDVAVNAKQIALEAQNKKAEIVQMAQKSKFVNRQKDNA